jgi:putative transcriptional regulator
VRPGLTLLDGASTTADVTQRIARTGRSRGGTSREPQLVLAQTYRWVESTLLKIEVRATGLRALREQRGLTQRQLAKDIGISQNYIPALEGGARRPGPGVQERLVKYFGCRFEDLFQLVLVNPETSQEQVLQPTGQKPSVTRR